MVRSSGYHLEGYEFVSLLELRALSSLWFITVSTARLKALDILLLFTLIFQLDVACARAATHGIFTVLWQPDSFYNIALPRGEYDFCQ